MSKFIVSAFEIAIIFLHHLLTITSVTAKISLQREVTHSKCIQTIFEEHFVGESVFVILPKFDTSKNDRFISMLQRKSYATVTIVNRSHKIPSPPLVSKPTNILFLANSRLDLIQSIKYLKSVNLWNPKAHVVVTLTNETVFAKRTSLLNMKETKKIFEIFMIERSIQVKLLMFDERHIPKLFAWFPFDGGNDCASKVRVIQSIGDCLSDWSNDRNEQFMVRTNHTLSSIIPRTFNDCPLKVTVVVTEPYSMCTNRMSACENGIEVRLFQSISQTLKLHLEFEIEETFNEAVYNKILKRDTDLLIGGINPVMKFRSKRFTQTASYYQDELTWCVAESSTITMWLSIFLVFDGETWGYFVLTIFSTGTVLYYFYKYYHHPENWCYCVTAGSFMAINISIPFNPTHRLLRFHLMVFCIFGIFLTSTFNSFFMTTITRPAKYKQISTTDDLIENSMKLYADNDTIALYQSDDSEFSHYFLRNHRTCTDKNSCLETFLSSLSDDIAVAASLEQALHYPNMINESTKVYCFHQSENIYVYPVAALAHEHFHLLDAINHQIQRTVESGLITKWEADVQLTKNKNFEYQGIVPFTIQNVSGGIIELFVGLTLASVAFVSELYFQAKRKSSRNSHPSMWRMCESIWVTTERNAWPEIGRYLHWLLRTRKK